MTFGMGITGISPTIGLGASAFGDYSGYMPSTMGLPTNSGYGSFGDNSIFGTGYGGMGGFGMGGMMNGLLEYQMYMSQLNNKIEENSIDHIAAMHGKMVNNNTRAHHESMSGMMSTMLADSAIRQGVVKLHEKIAEKDQKGVCQEYDKLKSNVYETYKKEMEKNGCAIAKADDANEYIEKVYYNMTGTTLRDDIKKHCGGALESGFLQGFKGTEDNYYQDETINHIYGERIDNRRNKDAQENIGKGLGMIGALFKDVGVGAAIGAGTYASGISLAALVQTMGGIGKASWWKTAIKHTGKAGLVGIALMLGYDIIKRFGNKDS